MIRLLLVDDDPLVRTGLRLILGGEPDIEIVGEAGDGADAEAIARKMKPDVALIDIRMPIQDGVLTVKHLLQWADPPRVIMLTTFHADDLVLSALSAGAAGFLLKDTAPDVLIDAVRAVAGGEPVMSPSVARQVISAATVDSDAGLTLDRARAKLDILTERELDVAVDIARGFSNVEIAKHYFVSVATVKATVTRIFIKLGAENRVSVAMRVRDAGLPRTSPDILPHR